ncbi:MAG: glutathione S-transferase C-terminal domain-containing protein, partial [Pseudomonadota bacterium]
AEARARFLRWLFYVSNTVHADLRVAFYAYRYVPEAHIPGLVGGVRARFARHLDMLEAEIARDGSLTGAGPTLADEYLAVCIRWAQNYPHASGAVLKDMSRWPVLLALLQGLEAADPVQTACRAEFIRDARPYTAPTLPDVPRSEITG